MILLAALGNLTVLANPMALVGARVKHPLNMRVEKNCLHCESVVKLKDESGDFGCGLVLLSTGEMAAWARLHVICLAGDGHSLSLGKSCEQLVGMCSACHEGQPPIVAALLGSCRQLAWCWYWVALASPGQ